ncbi:MAG TPA: Nif3-like dinuclear metal center hexameric protein [Haloplasmataceae bacterium]
MKTKDFENLALSFFPKETLDFFNDGIQYGFNNYFEKDIKRVSFSVNLTTDIIMQALDKKVDLILTHHNIWEDHFEMREDCLKLLKENNIIHFFNHLPLDSMDFGPSFALAKALNLNVVKRISMFEGFYFGVVGEFNNPVTLEELVQKTETVLTHKIRVWKNNERVIKKVGIVSGSGKDLESLHDAINASCDAYITGEKSLTTLLYAKHMGLNFLLGSHTFTELGGIKNYAELIQTHSKDLEVIMLHDEWIE